MEIIVGKRYDVMISAECRKIVEYVAVFEVLDMSIERRHAFVLGAFEDLKQQRQQLQVIGSS